MGYWRAIPLARAFIHTKDKMAHKKRGMPPKLNFNYIPFLG
tara:strand:+ start:122 stop:244 length:123 start_codon:yes stop_codon:yes gene_type:complete